MKGHIEMKNLLMGILLLPVWAAAMELNPSFTPEAVAKYKLKADAGDAEAQYLYSRALINGTGVEKNRPLAMGYAQKAARQNFGLAFRIVGEGYQKGWGVASNSIESVTWFVKFIEWARQASEQGDAQAQRNLAVCYSRGDGVEKNDETAAKWYRKAAEQGQAQAQLSLARCYYNGTGVAKDPEEAVKWCRKAAEQGDLRALELLARSCALGEGVKKDLEESKKWHRRAILQRQKLSSPEKIIGKADPRCSGEEVTGKATVGGVVWTYVAKHDIVRVYCESTSNTMGAIVIPSILDGRSVTCIGSRAFSNRDRMTSVVIPSSVMRIEDSAFNGCSGLTSVMIPSNVRYIGGYVFNGCSELTSFTVATNNPAYSSRNGLLCSKDGETLIAGVNGDVTIPAGVKSIGKRAFNGCDGLKSVVIPSSVTNIEDFAFNGCGGLTLFTVATNNPSYSSRNGLLCSKDGKTIIAGVNGDVVIPSGVKTIGKCAFNGCSGLKSVAIPPGMRRIGGCAFNGCSGLTSFSVASNNLSYSSRNGLLCSKDGETLIAGVNGDVVIPSGIKKIGDGAFARRGGLTSVKISSSVTSIGDDAFDDCENLTSFVADSANPRYTSTNGLLCSKDGLTLVAGVNGDVTIPSGVKKIGDGAFAGRSGLTSVKISSSVTNIGHSAFSRCERLATVAIPSTVLSIGVRAFSGTPYYESKPDGMVVLGEVLYEYKGKCPNAVVVPSNVTCISSHAFSHCSELMTVAIPSSVTCIERGAFTCVSAWVGGSFSRRDSACGGVTSFSVASNNPVYCSRNGLICSKDGSTLVVGVNGDVVIPTGVMRVCDSAFLGCTGLKSIMIPSSVTNIGDYAFSRCGFLSSVTIPSSVTHIGSGAFSWCSSLELVTMCGERPSTAVHGINIFVGGPKSAIHIPPNSQSWAGMTTWQGRALVSDEELDGFTWSYSVENGGSVIVAVDGKCRNALSSKPSGDVLVPLKLGGFSVTGIGSEVFGGCRRLTSVTIPSSVTNIENTAFLDCANLKAVGVVSDGKVVTISFDEFARKWKLKRTLQDILRGGSHGARQGMRIQMTTGEKQQKK